MSLWNSFRTLVTGFDAEAAQNQSASLDQQLAQLNTDTGYYDKLDAAAAAQAQANLTAQTTATSQIQSDYDQALIDGAKQGAANELAAVDTVSSTVGSTLGSLGTSILKIIPWWAWVGAGVWLFIELGGMGFLKRQVAKR